MDLSYSCMVGRGGQYISSCIKLILLEKHTLWHSASQGMTCYFFHLWVSWFVPRGCWCAGRGSESPGNVVLSFGPPLVVNDPFPPTLFSFLSAICHTPISSHSMPGRKHQSTIQSHIIIYFYCHIWCSKWIALLCPCPLIFYKKIHEEIELISYNFKFHQLLWHLLDVVVIVILHLWHLSLSSSSCFLCQGSNSPLQPMHLICTT